jgi:hypothetical protein
LERWIEQTELAQITGMVVPAFFSSKPTDDMVRRLLWVTLGECGQYLAWEHVWVVVDGDARTARLLAEVQTQVVRGQGRSFNTLVLPENHGKFWALKAGVAALLEASPSVDYVAMRDGDGDHTLADMPALLRAAVTLSEIYGDTRIIVLGARRSRHHPMGWVRGELETLLDRFTLDALSYRLAREGRVLNLSHCLRGDGVPDLSSGYKVYGRQSAQNLFLRAEPQYASLSAEDYWHFGPETVPIVEGLLQDTVIAEVSRGTWDGQPTTSFGEFRYVTLYGELISWICTRLQVPTEVAAQLYDNHAPKMLLRTTAEGRELLANLRRYALGKVAAQTNQGNGLPPERGALPFV